VQVDGEAIPTAVEIECLLGAEAFIDDRCDRCRVVVDLQRISEVPLIEKF
jgi:hypothetical protein